MDRASVEAQDAVHWRDPKFRHFRDELDSALQQFERAQEWADLIRYLQRLQRVLTKYSQLPVIPDKILVAKRLFQCLNSSLPSGVHLTTLQTYELIFSRIGSARLARDLAFYTEGIFTLYRHAAYQVKPVLLDLFERHFVTLGAAVVPCLPGLVMALLTAMEDVGSEYHSRAIRLLDQLASGIPIEPFMSAVWGCLLRNSSVRLQALNYINLRFPPALAPLGSPAPDSNGTPSTAGATAAGGAAGAGGGNGCACGAGPSGVASCSTTPGGDTSERLPVSRRAFCPDAQGSVLRSLIVALQQGDSLVRRTALELLVTHFPLPAGPASSEERPFGAVGRLMDAAGLGMLTPSRAAATSAGKSRCQMLTPSAASSRPPRLVGDEEQLFSDADFTTLLRVALTLLPLCEWSLSRRVLFWVFRSPPPHVSSGVNLALPQDAAPLLLGALRQLFTCAAAPPPPAAAANDEYDDPLAPRAEAAPLSPSPFRTLVHVLDVPALAEAISGDDALLLAALSAAAPRCPPPPPSHQEDALRFFSHERLPTHALWRACMHALLSLHPQPPAPTPPRPHAGTPGGIDGNGILEGVTENSIFSLALRAAAITPTAFVGNAPPEFASAAPRACAGGGGGYGAPPRSGLDDGMTNLPLELLDVSTGMLARLSDASDPHTHLPDSGGRAGGMTKIDAGADRPPPPPVRTPSDTARGGGRRQAPDAGGGVPLPHGAAALVSMLLACCRVASAAVASSEHALLLGCLHLHHNLLSHLAIACQRAAGAAESAAAAAPGFTPAYSAPQPASPMVIVDEAKPAATPPAASPPEPLSASLRDMPAAAQPAAADSAAAAAAAAATLDAAMALVMGDFSDFFLQLVRAASRAGGDARGGGGAAGEPAWRRAERRNGVEGPSREPPSGREATLLCALSLGARLLLVQLRVCAPAEPIPWGGTAGGLGQGGDAGGRRDPATGLAPSRYPPSGWPGSWGVPPVVASVLGSHRLASYASSAASQSPFSFGLGRAPHATLASPPIAWAKATDDLYLSLVRSPTAGPAALAEARITAGELAAAAVGASAKAGSAEAGRAVAGAVLGPAPGEPAWLSALVEGCGSASFAVLATCAPTLAHAIQAGAVEAASSQPARPGAPLPLGTRRAVGILSCVWHFLGAQDGATQHASALLWTRLQSLWPDACAAVVASRLRAAARACDDADDSAIHGAGGAAGGGVDEMPQGGPASRRRRDRMPWTGRRGRAGEAVVVVASRESAGGGYDGEEDGEEEEEEEAGWGDDAGCGRVGGGGTGSAGTGGGGTGGAYPSGGGGGCPPRPDTGRPQGWVKDRSDPRSAGSSERSHRVALATDAFAAELARFSLLWRAALLAAPRRKRAQHTTTVREEVSVVAASPAFGPVGSPAAAPPVAEAEPVPTSFPVMYSSRPELSARDETEALARCSNGVDGGAVAGGSRVPPGDWADLAPAAETGGAGLAGVGLLLALDALQHPSSAVRDTAGRWLDAASSFPPPLLTPLLAMLVAPRCTARVRLYALAKLRAVLAASHDGFIARLGVEPAPPHLLAACRTAMRSAPLAPAVLPSTGGSLLLLLAAGTLLQVLQPATPRPAAAASPLHSPLVTPLPTTTPADPRPAFSLDVDGAPKTDAPPDAADDSDAQGGHAAAAANATTDRTGADRFRAGDAAGDVSRDMSADVSGDAPKGVSTEASRSRDTSRDVSKDVPRDAPRDASREASSRDRSGSRGESSRRLRFGDSAQALATELMTSLLHGTPAHIGKPLSALLLQPVLRILRASVGSSVGRGAQAQLLALAFAALSQSRQNDGKEAGHPRSLLSELLVPTVTAGLADTRSPVWSHWAGFGVACLVHCVHTRASDAATAMVVALLTTLSELLLYQHATLPPQQLEALLVALHHTHHFCVLGFEAGPAGWGAALHPPGARRPSPELASAQQAMYQQLPSVLWALLHAWTAAPPNDAHMRQLAIAPIALLSAHCRRELLAAVLYVWEQHCMGAERRPVHHEVGHAGGYGGGHAGGGYVGGHAGSGCANGHSGGLPGPGGQAPEGTAASGQRGEAGATPSGIGAHPAGAAAPPSGIVGFTGSLRGRPDYGGYGYFGPAGAVSSGGPGGVQEAALLEFLSEVPECAPHQMLATAAEIVQQGRPGSSPVRVPLPVVHRFLARYVQVAVPVRSLAEGWVRLMQLLRGGMLVAPTAPVGMVVVLWEWVQRMEADAGEASPLLRARERHEAKDVAELLLRALASQLSRSARRPERAGGADRPPREPDAPLLQLGAHCAGWDETDMGVLCLLGLERTMMPLLAVLFPPKPHGREHAIELLVALLPAAISPLEAIVSGGAARARTERLAHASLLVLLRVIATPATTRAWRRHVGKLFGSPGFFAGLSRRTLPLWARAVNAWLCLETPKGAVTTLLAGKTGITAGWFASRAQEAGALADLLRRLSFALWVGERNQYVGALQGMLIDKLVAAFKYGSAAGDGAASVRWVVQVGAMNCARVLAVRVSPENLTSLWPIAMAELQRVLLHPAAAQPALLLAACQLIDMLLTVLPDDFAPFGWMFVPASQAAAGAIVEPGASPSEFAALLAPLTVQRSAARPSPDQAAPPTPSPDPPSADAPHARRGGGGGLLAPAADGRRRPLLALRTLTDMAELAPFASRLHDHLVRSALEPRGTEIDHEMIDVLLGCAFLSPAEAAREIRPHLAGGDGADFPKSEVIGVRRVV